MTETAAMRGACGTAPEHHHPHLPRTDCQGAAWSTKEGRLVDAAPKQLIAPLPVVHVTAVLARDRRRGGLYNAPMYK